MKKSLMIFSIIFVLFFSMAASVLGTKVLSQQQITNDGWEHKYPDVYGNIIVWDDFRDDNHNIYGYNLLTNQEFLIAADINGDENSFNDGYPAIWGDYVTWAQDGKISIYNLKTKQVKLVGEGYAFPPDIFEDTVVWEESFDIFAYNLKTGDVRTLGDGSYPAINGDIVVWANGNYIYGFNLKSSTTPFLIRDGTNVGNPAIYGDIVVWEEGGDYKIWKHNLKTGEQVPISPSYSSYPSIYGDIVVWVYDLGDEYYINGYNLKTGQEFLIRDSEGNYLDYTAIYCGRVVWYESADTSNGEHYQIFLANLDVVCEEAKNKPLPMDWILKKFGLGKFKNN